MMALSKAKFATSRIWGVVCICVAWVAPMGRSFRGELMRVESASYPIGMARLFSPSALLAVAKAAGGGLGLFICGSRHGALRCGVGAILSRVSFVQNVCF